jgi:3-oxoacyl-[acyl-carrier-protein] synthase-3
MRWNDLYVAGTGVWLPERQPVGPAVAAGLVGQAHLGLGFETIAIDEDDTAPPDMAVRAGTTALARAGLPHGEIGLHLHASLWFQGLDCWTPAHYIANKTSGPQALPFGIDQRSAGGMAGIHLAAGHLSAGLATAAMITTADRFAAPGVNRWSSYLQCHWGDGGTALILSNRTGFARVLTTVASAANDLEAWDRGTSPFAPSPMHETPVPITRRVLQQAATPEAGSQWKIWAEFAVRTCEQALEEAGLRREDIARAVLPFVHRGNGEEEMHDLLGFPEERTLWLELGRYVGHLGAGDQLAGLNHLIEHRLVTPGDKILLYSLGAGFTYNAIVLEILQLPEW